jgi:hypothetical protein
MVEMMTVKMHLNSVISTKGAHYCTIDLKDFYLNTPMERPEYMRLKLSNLPHDFVDMYKITKIAQDNDSVYKDTKGNVRPSTSRHTCTSTVGTTTK